MSDAARSDEPTRVSQLISKFLSGQTGAILGTEDGPRVRLTGGADIKDDCAIYDIDEPLTLVAGSDYVRGPKFALYELGLLSNFDLGYYVVAANVSDIAAMGAAPIGLLTVVRYPHNLDDDGFHDIMAGIHQAATDFGTLNIGGDIGGAERIILSASALGVCGQGKVLRRSGARPGDALCVTGPCGLLGAAVAYFPNKEERGWELPDDIEGILIDSWRRPQARVGEGQLLGRMQLATACQDTSDGLKATIEQLGEASGVGFEVFESAIEVHTAVRDVAKILDIDSVALALSASSDFQLAFTVRRDVVDRCQEEFALKGLSFDVVGTATTPRVYELVRNDGSRVPLPGVAWKHQGPDASNLVRDHHRK